MSQHSLPKPWLLANRSDGSIEDYLCLPNNAACGSQNSKYNGDSSETKTNIDQSLPGATDSCIGNNEMGSDPYLENNRLNNLSRVSNSFYNNAYNSDFNGGFDNNSYPYNNFGPYRNYRSFGSHNYNYDHGYDYRNYGNNYSEFCATPTGNQMSMNKGVRWLNSVQSFSNGFGRVACVLDNSSQSLHGTIASILHLFENCNYLSREIVNFIANITTFRLIRKIYRKYIAKNSKTNYNGNNDLFGDSLGVNESINSPQSITLSLFKIFKYISIYSILILGGIFSSRILRNFVYRYIKMQSYEKIYQNSLLSLGIPERNDDFMAHSGPQNTPHLTEFPLFKMHALCDWIGKNENELSFKKGDIIYVWSKPYDEWWQGELESNPGVFGLFPVIHTQPV